MVHLKTVKGIGDRIVQAGDVSGCECKVVLECLKCDCANEVHYTGGLRMFRVYASHH